MREWGRGVELCPLKNTDNYIFYSVAIKLDKMIGESDLLDYGYLIFSFANLSPNIFLQSVGKKNT